MQAIKITDGRTSLWQWDTGVRIKVYGCTDVDQMHFVTPGGIISRELVNNECDVPDTALRTDGLLKMYAFDRTENGGVTRCDFLLMVKARPKPADYIDPPDEYDNLEALAERVAGMIPGGGGSVTPEQIGAAVEEYLAENPVEGEPGPQGPQGERGEQGPPGADGSDATVTAANVTAALGYTPADKETVESLSEEIAPLYDVLIMKKNTNDAGNLMQIDAAAQVFERTDGKTTTGRFTWDSENNWVVCNQSMSAGGVFFAGQKLTVKEGEVYTIAAYVKFGDGTTQYKAHVSLENQHVINDLTSTYVAGSWAFVRGVITVNATTASKELARVTIMPSNDNCKPMYVRDLFVAVGDVSPEDSGEADSERLKQIEARISAVEEIIADTKYDWETPTREYSALFKNAANAESFLFFTDPHLNEGSGWEDRFHEYTEFIRKVYESTPVTFVMCGGDWIGNSDTMDEACYKLGRIDARMRGLFREYCPVLGNHDTNDQGILDVGSAIGTGTLSNSAIRNLWFRREGAAYYRYEGASSAMYVLDSGSDAGAMDEYRWQQIDWLAETLKTEKQPDAFIALHIIRTPSDETAIFADNALAVAEAYNAKTTFTLNGTTYDFTGCTGKVRFAIGGHTHADSDGVLHNIPYVITTRTRQNNKPTFDLALADYDAGALHLVRVGDGESRTVAMT